MKKYSKKYKLIIWLRLLINLNMFRVTYIMGKSIGIYLDFHLTFVKY